MTPARRGLKPAIMRIFGFAFGLFALAGCTPTLDTTNYIRFTAGLPSIGKYIDNKKFSASCGKSDSIAGGASVQALGIITNGYDDFIGLRIELTPGMLGANSNFIVSPNGPVSAYVIWPNPDAGTLGQGATPLNGEIRIDQYSEIEGERYQGTIINLASSDGPVPIGIDSGNFQGAISGTIP